MIGQCGRTPCPKSSVALIVARREIDRDEMLTVRAGLSDAGVAVNRHVGGAAIGRGDDLVTGDAILGHQRDLTPGLRIDETERALAFVRDEEETRPPGGASGRRPGHRDDHQQSSPGSVARKDFMGVSYAGAGLEATGYGSATIITVAPGASFTGRTVRMP